MATNVDGVAGAKCYAGQGLSTTSVFCSRYQFTNSAAGKMRGEGKEYIVKDGDVLNFLFNV